MTLDACRNAVPSRRLVAAKVAFDSPQAEALRLILVDGKTLYTVGRTYGMDIAHLYRLKKRVMGVKEAAACHLCGHPL